MAKKIALISEMLNTEQFESIFDHAVETNDAVVLTTFGSGSIPSRFTEKIRRSVRNGHPIFLLIGTQKTAGIDGEKSGGITGVTYGTQQDVLEAGAVHLESVNIGHYMHAVSGESTRTKDDVLNMLKTLAEETEDMFEFIRRVREVYNLTDDEIKFLEQASEVNSAPITRDKILKSRHQLDAVLDHIKQEVESERAMEIEGRGRVK